MKRRNALKIAALGLLAPVVPTFAKENMEFCNLYVTYRPEIKNRNRYHKSDKPTKGELKHTPDIKIGNRDAQGFTVVEVSLGQAGIIHPSAKNHWIDFIEVYTDGSLVARHVIEPGNRGYASFKIKLDGVRKLKAVAGCNIHGIWDEEITL